MTKRKELQLNEMPVDLSEKKESKQERLAKLLKFEAEEMAAEKPCMAYLNDLGMSIFMLKTRGL